MKRGVLFICLLFTFFISGCVSDTEDDYIESVTTEITEGYALQMLDKNTEKPFGYAVQLTLVNTEYKTQDIWLKRFELSSQKEGTVYEINSVATDAVNDISYSTTITLKPQEEKEVFLVFREAPPNLDTFWIHYIITSISMTHGSLSEKSTREASIKVSVIGTLEKNTIQEFDYHINYG